jgi:hypothetical protein
VPGNGTNIHFPVLPDKEIEMKISNVNCIVRTKDTVKMDRLLADFIHQIYRLEISNVTDVKDVAKLLRYLFRMCERRGHKVKGR